MERTPILKRPRGGITTIVIIALILSAVFLYIEPTDTKSTEIPLSTFMESARGGEVTAVSVKDNRLDILFKDSKQAYTIKEPTQKISDILAGIPQDVVNKIKVQVQDTEASSFWTNLLISVVPFLLIVGFFLFMFRQAQSSNNQALSFGRSQARLFDKENKKTTFAEVAGAKEAKTELIEVVDFLKNPTKYQSMGAKIPKGVLLIGAPGTGKTLLARAVAGEANVPFFNISGSEFVEMFVGVGASRVRDLFRKAKRNAPCIIFIDEIDAVGRQRGAGLGGGHDEREQTLNQILTEMDGFETDTNVIVMAASVTGDTPVLVKRNGDYELASIAKVIDSYYEQGEDNVEKDALGLEVLGMEKRERSDRKQTKNLYFGSSAFKKVKSVFRHYANEIFEIDFLGGRVRTTGNHSVFVKSKYGIVAKRVDALKVGEFLVDIPYVVNRTQKAKLEVRAHAFANVFSRTLPVYKNEYCEELQYDYALVCKGERSQGAIAKTLGVSQTTVSKWQNTARMPRPVSRAYFNHELPEEVRITPELCRLFGYYVSEGYSRKEIDFCFNKREIPYIDDVKNLMKQIFGIDADRIRNVTSNATNIIYYAKPLADFFANYCGKGAHAKHVPEFLFEAPKEYFIEFFRGYFAGDGYQDKKGKIEATSVSKRLILELHWLSRMHGFKSFFHSFAVPAGRTINNGKPLSETIAWRLGFGKTQNPLHPACGKQSVKRAKIIKITKKAFDGYVYDFCGCENEAFFGGETPLLLHNTNRPDVLDPALLRPGRFDRRIVVDQPDIKDREEILKVHARNKPLSKDVDFEKVARQTSGFVGADLENLMNEAAILAARHNKKKVGMKEVEHSIEKVLMGPERKSKVLSKREKDITAYHEVGHALVAYMTPGCDPVHKVSIISRGMALGVTWFMPEEDKHLYSKSKFEAELASLLGGYVSEELTFGRENVTTGASNDLERATEIARKMVTMYGMSELGPVIYGDHHREIFLGRDFGHVRNYSEEISSKIDSEIHRFIEKAYEKAKDILNKNKKKLGEIAVALLEKETITREEFLAFFQQSSAQMTPAT